MRKERLPHGHRHGTAGALCPKRKSAVACLAARFLQARASPAARQSAATLRAQGTRHFLSSHACSRYNTFILSDWQTSIFIFISISSCVPAYLFICLPACKQPLSTLVLYLQSTSSALISRPVCNTVQFHETGTCPLACHRLLLPRANCISKTIQSTACLSTRLHCRPLL
jgi:hypothetical protein